MPHWLKVCRGGAKRPQNYAGFATFKQQITRQEVFILPTFAILANFNLHSSYSGWNTSQETVAVMGGCVTPFHSAGQGPASLVIAEQARRSKSLFPVPQVLPKAIRRYGRELQFTHTRLSPVGVCLQGNGNSYLFCPEGLSIHLTVMLGSSVQALRGRIAGYELSRSL